MITPPNMSAYQPDRIRLPGKRVALTFASIQEAIDWIYRPATKVNDDSWIEFLPTATKAYVLAKRPAA